MMEKYRKTARWSHVFKACALILTGLAGPVGDCAYAAEDASGLYLGELRAPEIKGEGMNGKAYSPLFKTKEVALEFKDDSSGRKLVHMTGNPACRDFSILGSSVVSNCTVYDGVGGCDYNFGSYNISIFSNCKIYCFPGSDGNDRYLVNVEPRSGSSDTALLGERKVGVCLAKSGLPGVGVLQTKYNREKDCVEGANQWGQLIGDVVFIDTSSEKFRTANMAQYSGSLLEYGGKWYRVDVDAKTGKVQFVPQQPALGTLKIKNKHWYALLLGTKGIYAINDAGETPVVVPADTYLLAQYSEILPSKETGMEASLTVGAWVMRNIEKPKPKPFEIVPGKETVLVAGSPISVYSTFKNGIFVLSTEDVSGKNVSLRGEDGEAPSMPEVSVRDSTGKEVYHFKYEAG